MLEVGSFKNGACEIRSSEVGIPQHSSREVRLTQITLSELDSLGMIDRSPLSFLSFGAFAADKRMLHQRQTLREGSAQKVELLCASFVTDPRPSRGERGDVDRHNCKQPRSAPAQDCQGLRFHWIFPRS